MPRTIKTRPVSKSRAVLAQALDEARSQRLRSWRTFEPIYLKAMHSFDQLVANGETEDGDRRNGKGDALNDFLVTLLENCSGKELHNRPEVPGLSFRRHLLDISYPDDPDPVELVIETKASGIPLHAGNKKQKNPEGRPGSADTEKRVKEASLKNIDIKAEAARGVSRGGGPTQDLGSWMRTAKPRCFMLMAVRVTDDNDLRKTIAHADAAATWFDRCGLYCYGWDPTHSFYEPRPVTVSLELDRVLATVCDALRHLP